MLFSSVCLSGGAGHPQTKEKPFKAEPSLSQRQHSPFDLPMNQAGFVLLNSSLNLSPNRKSLNRWKAWVFSESLFPSRAKLAVSHGGKEPPASRPGDSPRSYTQIPAGDVSHDGRN